MKSREGFTLNQEEETPEAEKVKKVKSWAIRHAAQELLEAK